MEITRRIEAAALRVRSLLRSEDPCPVAAAFPPIVDGLDTRPLWASGGTAPEHRGELVTLLERMQASGLRFTLAQSFTMGVPTATRVLDPQALAETLLAGGKDVFVDGADLHAERVSSLATVRVLDALYGTRNREGLEHPLLAASLDHLGSLGLTFALGKSSEEAPRPVSRLAAYQRYIGDHQQHDYSGAEAGGTSCGGIRYTTLHTMSRDGSVDAKTFYEEDLSTTAFFDFDAPSSVMGEHADVARLMRALARKGSKFYRAHHDYCKEDEGRLADVKELWKDMVRPYPPAMWVEVPGAPKWMKLSVSGLYGASTLCTDVLVPMTAVGTMGRRDAYALLIPYYDTPRGWTEARAVDLVERVDARIRGTADRAWPLKSNELRMTGWAYGVTVKALDREPRLAGMLDQWIDYVIARGPHDAEQSLASLVDGASDVDLRLRLAFWADTAAGEKALRELKASGNAELTATMLGREAARGSETRSERLGRAREDAACVASQAGWYAGGVDEALGRFEAVAVLLPGYAADDVRNAFVAATGEVNGGRLSWDEVTRRLSEATALRTPGTGLRAAVERHEGRGPTLEVAADSVIIAGVRVARQLQ